MITLKRSVVWRKVKSARFRALFPGPGKLIFAHACPRGGQMDESRGRLSNQRLKALVLRGVEHFSRLARAHKAAVGSKSICWSGTLVERPLFRRASNPRSNAAEGREDEARSPARPRRKTCMRYCLRVGWFAPRCPARLKLEERIPASRCSRSTQSFAIQAFVARPVFELSELCILASRAPNNLANVWKPFLRLPGIARRRTNAAAEQGADLTSLASGFHSLADAFKMVEPRGVEPLTFSLRMVTMKPDLQ